MTDPRLTIGLVTANIHLGVGATLWSGALAAAERHGVDLLCFPGGELGETDRPRNAVYDLAGPDVLDGLICWTSTLAVPEEHPRAARLTRRFGRLPMVSLNGAMGDARPLTVDSYRGMCTAISHLVEVHGRRRLAFIRGTVTNPVIVDRYRAYTDTLARHRIPLDRALVSAPVDFHVEAGGSAMRVLLDARALRPGRDFDAVVACSDLLAADALRVLSERGVRVPDDIAVIGVNDSQEARLADPPLTSVSMPFAELGELAVETLVAQLRGCGAAQVRSPASTLVVRRSCGCPGTLTAQLDDEPADPGVTRLDELRAAAPDGEPAAGLLRALDGGDDRTFLRGVEAAAGAAARTRDIEAQDTALADLHRLALRHTTGAVRVRAERLLGRARLIAAEAGRRLLEYERWEAEQTSRRLRELGNALSAAVDLTALDEVLTARLPALGIPGHRLFLEPVLPPGALPVGRRYSAVVEPLFVRDELLGFGLFEVGPRAGAVYRALGDQISATVKEIALFDEVRAARDLAEKADRVKTRLLSNVSDELRAPMADIRGRVESALRTVGELADVPAGLVDELKEVQVSAEHQLGVLSDLLDLSKAEIDTLDLTPELISPVTLVPGLGDGLPLIQGDRRRLRQVFVTLQSYLGGAVAVSARVRPPELCIRLHRDGAVPGADVLDSGIALPITRRLIALHNGSLRYDSGRDGVTFHVSLPLPSPHGHAVVPRSADCVLAVGGDGPVRGLGLPVRRLHAREDLAGVLEDARPAAVAWDLARTSPEDWSVVRHLHDHPRLRRTPFLLYGSTSGRDLDAAITALRPTELAGPVVVADVDASARAAHHRLVTRIRPGHLVLGAPDGTSALAALGRDVPSLVIVSLALPDMDGFDLLDRLNTRLTDVPALVLGGHTITAEDVRRASPYTRAVLLGRDILTAEETEALVTRLCTPRAATPPRSSTLVKHAVAFLHQHYHHQITRRQVAQAAGMSEDYLSRTFHRELCVSPWDYLNRLRIQRAKERLRDGDESIQVVARRVGFSDRAYFSRMFRKLTGMPPAAYRESCAPRRPAEC